MPALKYSKTFWWLIHKQDNDLSIGMKYTSEFRGGVESMELLGSEDDHPMSWIDTHFHVFPLVVPLNILNFDSPQAGSNIPKG